MGASEKVVLEVKSREKSALYPAVSIAEALEFIKQIDSLGGKTVSYSSILSLLGVTSPTTKSFMNRISSSKQFGLITTGGSTAQLTDLGRRILYPNEGQKETQRLLVDAFQNPPLYVKLVARFNNRAVPSVSQLSNLLMNEYRIIKAVKDNAAKCFLDSANHLGLIQNGVLVMDDPDDNFDKAPINVEPEKPAETPPLAQKSGGNQEDGYSFEIPTMGKKTARFYIPDGITPKDIDYIKFYIEHMLPVFLDNLRSEL